MIMVTFTKLFVIKIVASVRSESSRSFMIFLSRSSLLSSSSFKSVGDSEKKAISEPEANPEKSKSRQDNTIAIIAPSDGA